MLGTYSDSMSMILKNKPNNDRLLLNIDILLSLQVGRYVVATRDIEPLELILEDYPGKNLGTSRAKTQYMISLAHEVFLGTPITRMSRIDQLQSNTKSSLKVLRF